jgi:hypothetical protein
LLVPALVVFLAAMYWLRERLADQDSVRQVHEPAQAVPRASVAEAPAAAPEVQKPRATAPSPPPPVVHARAEAGLVAHDEEGTVEPHPISDERKALMPPWGTVEDVFGAIETREFERARTLLEQRQKADPNREDFRGYYLGLEVMLDCLQNPGEESQARAKSFIMDPTVRASPMRRHVRRHCMAGKPGAAPAP